MTREEIIRMAREAGISGPAPARHGFKMYANPQRLERFAGLVAAAEREECAKVCDREARRALFNWHNDIPANQKFWNGGEQLASGCAATIRARGQA